VARERERAIGDVVLLWVFLAVGREGERGGKKERKGKKRVYGFKF
jgi:hypothetical protein